MPEKLRLMVTLASWCAMRFGEAVELRRGDVDLVDEVIRIRRAAVRTKGAYTITTPKSDAGLRDVAIPPHIIPLIEDYLAKYVVKGRDSLMFPPRMAATCSRPRYTGIGTRRGRRPSAKDLRLHDLRHSGAVLPPRPAPASPS